MVASSDREAHLKRGRGARSFVTAEDVARLAGVSRSAVSRTFTSGASVSAEVRQRVQDAAVILGYRVNRLASSLNSDRSNLIGLVGANLSLPFMARQLDELSRALLRRGMQCLLLNAAEAEQEVSRLIELVLEFRVRAVVVMSGSPPSSIIDECIANGVRVILVNRQTNDTEADTIVSDDLGGARIAAKRLLQADCQRIGILGSGKQTSSQFRRRVAFTDCIEKAGIEPVIGASGETTYEAGVEAAKDLLGCSNLDGVFCVTDLLALGFLDGTREMGIRIPNDLSVIGFDDIPQSAWAPYLLTTIRQPMVHLTQAVLAAIERDMLGNATDLLHEVLPVELVERATVRKVTRPSGIR